jgi:hypothetical protein
MTRQRIVYLARRNPLFAVHDDWVPRWRAHWALAASQPESATVRRYAQCEVLVDIDPDPHDAVATSEYWSPEARLANRSATGYHAIMTADELEVFDRPILECAFFGTFVPILGAAEGPFKVVRFLRSSRPAFVDAWVGWSAWLHDVPDGLLGYAQTRALGPRSGSGLDVDGCEEFWFADRAAAEAFLRGPELARATRDLPAAVVAAVVTDEVVLKDRPLDEPFLPRTLDQ